MFRDKMREYMDNGARPGGLIEPLGRQALAGRARDFSEKVRGLFLPSRLVDWETRYRALAFGYRAPEPVPLETS